MAATAGLSRSWIYRDSNISAEVRRLRRPSTGGQARAMPSRQRATDPSLQARLETLLDSNRDLRDQNQKLRQQIAVLLGEKRRASVSDMSPKQPPRST